MSGGVLGAEERRLSVMVGAEPEEFRALEPLLHVMGTTVRRVGALGAGQVAKTCNQVVVATTMAGLSEAFYLARASGVDPEALHEILDGGLAASEILRQKGRNWLEESFEPGGRARFHLKDFTAARELSELGGVRLPVTDAVARQYERLVELGLGDLDHSGVYRALGASGDQR
ncbi:NAD-binding protein [Georgenia sp. SUBG003]|uniref:NAD(P)-dependent oxidoreductase n=1 Tax=Georgenia sp. SUBG003 TaxID=1497974 RepID=UPI000693DB47